MPNAPVESWPFYRETTTTKNPLPDPRHTDSNITASHRTGVSSLNVSFHLNT